MDPQCDPRRRGELARIQRAESTRRWRLLTDALTFQVKLVIDNLMDALLVPLSMVAAALDLVFGQTGSRSLFYSVVRLGRRLDGWINLFSAAHQDDPDARAAESAVPGAHGIDAHLERLEEVLAEQSRKGGVTASAKQAIDHWLDNLQTKVGRSPSSPTDRQDPPR